MEKHVKFLGYDGRYPNLCDGTLGLEIDGKALYFRENKRFWVSGGCCSHLYAEGITKGLWRINKNDLPVQYRQYANEIAEVFNANVPYGCCGGCI